MNNELKKKQILFIGAAIGLLAVFGYGIYAAMGSVFSAEREYTTKYKQLVDLEEKHKQATNLEGELSDSAAQVTAIKQALINQTYENKLKLVIDLENTAKSAGLVYDLSILKELTKESLVEEKVREVRARRKSQQIREELVQEQFPSIVFNVKLSGSYPAIVGFIEKLHTLSYYIAVGNFNIISKKLQGEGGGSVEAVLEITVFTA